MRPPTFDTRWQQAAQAARRSATPMDADAAPAWLVARVLAAARAPADMPWAELLAALGRRLVLASLGLFLASGAWLSWEMRRADLVSPGWLDTGALSLTLLLP